MVGPTAHVFTGSSPGSALGGHWQTKLGGRTPKLRIAKAKHTPTAARANMEATMTDVRAARLWRGFKLDLSGPGAVPVGGASDAPLSGEACADCNCCERAETCSSSPCSFALSAMSASWFSCSFFSSSHTCCPSIAFADVPLRTVGGVENECCGLCSFVTVAFTCPVCRPHGESGLGLPKSLALSLSSLACDRSIIPGGES
mmetsp:Transcript_28268/g.57368  ORF Transcript_28268/g.57368 Transcript_28268/m.57368 type:complete len:201 (-) Transcript_28268:52-654(-)